MTAVELKVNVLFS